MSIKLNCPICSKPSTLENENPYRPFCSKRCQLIDLGKWAEESYNITDPVISNDDLDYPDPH